MNGVYRSEDCANDDPDEPCLMLRVRSVTYGDLLGRGDEEAVISLNYSTGGTANWDYLYVYRDGRDYPVLLARMETGSRGAGGLLRVVIEHGLLVVDFADKDRMMGECCSAGYIRVRYRWRQGEFVEVGRTRGDMEMVEGPLVNYWAEKSPDYEQTDFSSDDENWERPLKAPEEVLRIIRTQLKSAPDELPTNWLVASEIQLDGPEEKDLIVMGIGGLRGRTWCHSGSFDELPPHMYSFWARAETD